MKKKVIYFVAVATWMFSHAQAQSYSAVPDHVNATNAIDALTTLSVSPGYLLYGIPETSGGTVGDAYLNSDWKKATLKFSGNEKEFNIQQCKINLYSNQIEVNYHNAIMAIDGSKVERFILEKGEATQRVFLNASAYKIVGITQVGFLEELVIGNTFLFRKVRVIVKRPDYNIQLNVGSKNTKIVKEKTLCFAKGTELINVKSMKRKNLASFFGDFSPAIDKFIRGNSFKWSVEEDVILIFKYYNQEMDKKGAVLGVQQY